MANSNLTGSIPCDRAPPLYIATSRSSTRLTLYTTPKLPAPILLCREKLSMAAFNSAGVNNRPPTCPVTFDTPCDNHAETILVSSTEAKPWARDASKFEAVLLLLIVLSIAKEKPWTRNVLKVDAVPLLITLPTTEAKPWTGKVPKFDVVPVLLLMALSTMKEILWISDALKFGGVLLLIVLSIA